MAGAAAVKDNTSDAWRVGKGYRVFAAGNECALRAWELTDADSLVKYANNPNVSQNLRDRFPYPYTKEYAINFLNMCAGTAQNSLPKFPAPVGHLAVVDELPTHFAIALRKSGEAIGGIGLIVDPHADTSERHMGELSYWLAEQFWGRGIASEAISLLLQQIIWPRTGIHRVKARVYARNPASRRALEKNGFHLEALMVGDARKEGKFIDVHLLATMSPTGWAQRVRTGVPSGPSNLEGSAPDATKQSGTGVQLPSNQMLVGSIIQTRPAAQVQGKTTSEARNQIDSKPGRIQASPATHEHGKKTLARL